MPNNVVKIMDIPFQNCTHQSFINEKILPKIKENEKCFIVTANPEIVMETKRNTEYKEIITSANYVVPDGIGVLLAAKWKGEPLKERIAGFDLMMDLLQYANVHHLRCFFLGGTSTVNEQVVIEVNKRFPHLIVAGHHHGYIEIDDSKIVNQVKTSNSDLIFVALGFPKQEQWISRNIQNFNKGIFVGVGGSFDVLSGNVKRAPNVWIKLNLEWLYRLLKQPFRWKRLLLVFKFIGISFFRRNHI